MEDPRAANRAKARQLYLDIVAKDESASGSYLMLSVIDSDSPEERRDWLRKSVAADSREMNVRSLINHLFQLGTPESIHEAIDLAESNYANAVSDEQKWRRASNVYGTYQTANARLPTIIGPDDSDEFVSRVRQDSQWDEVLQILEDPVSQVNAVPNALQTVCILASIFGDGPCMRGAERIVQAATISSASQYATIFADAVASGMMAYPYSVCMVECPDTRTPRLNLLAQLSAAGLDTLIVLEAIATISLDREQRREYRREIVLRNPDSAQARFQLGKVYYDQRLWSEAVVQLEIAADLSPPEDQIYIKAYLRQANYEVANN